MVEIETGDGDKKYFRERIRREGLKNNSDSEKTERIFYHWKAQDSDGRGGEVLGFGEKIIAWVYTWSCSF